MVCEQRGHYRGLGLLVSRGPIKRYLQGFCSDGLQIGPNTTYMSILRCHKIRWRGLKRRNRAQKDKFCTEYPTLTASPVCEALQYAGNDLEC